MRQPYRRLARAIHPMVRNTLQDYCSPPELPLKEGDMWPYPWTHVRTPSHPGYMDWVAAILPSQTPARATSEAPDLRQWEGQDVLLA